MSRRWKILLFLAGCVTLLVIGAIGWFFSDGDIRAVIAEAKAAGIPTTEAELGWPPATADQQALFSRLLALNTTRAFRDTPKNADAYPYLGEPPTPALVEYVAQIRPEYWLEIESTIAAFGDRRWSQRIPGDFLKDTWGSRLQENSLRLNLLRLVGERIRVGRSEELPKLTRQASAIVQLQIRKSFIDQLAMLSSIEVLVDDLSSRIVEVRGNIDRKIIIEELSNLRRHCWNTRAEASEVEFVSALARIDQIGPVAGKSRPLPSITLSMEWLKSLESWTQEQLRFVHWRLIRADFFRRIFYPAVAFRNATDVADLNTQISKYTLPADTSNWLVKPIYARSSSHTTDPLQKLSQSFAQSLGQLDVLIGELTDTSPVLDLCDPKGGPVRPIMRNGSRIGWYSIGLDGVDNGGKVDLDYGFQVSEKLGSPLFSAPLPLRPTPTP